MVNQLGFLTRESARDVETRRSPSDDYWYTPVVPPVAAGVDVDHNTAMTASAVWACVRLITETMSTLGLQLLERVDKGKVENRDHHAWRAVAREPNPWMSPVQFWQIMWMAMETQGKGAAFKTHNRRGHLQLYPISPERLEANVIGNKRAFLYRPRDGGKPIALRNDEVMYFVPLSRDGIHPTSPVEVARQGIGISLAAEQYTGAFYGNNARPAGVVVTPPGTRWKDEDKKRFRAEWQQLYGGSRNAHKVALLEDDVKFVSIGLSQRDAEYLATRKFQVTEISRIWHVPPHMIGDLERSTNNNIEHQGIEFEKHTIRPRAKYVEDVIGYSLLSPAERDELLFEYNLDHLLRGDFKSRIEGLVQAVINGIMSRNEARDKMNLNAIEGLDVMLQAVNMTGVDGDGLPMDEGGDSKPEAPEKDGDANTRSAEPYREIRALVDKRLKLREQMRPVLHASASRVVKREVADVRRLMEKYDDPQVLTERLNEYWHNDAPGFIREAFDAPFRSYAAMVVEAVADEGERSVRAEIQGLDEFIAAVLRAFADKHSAKARRALERSIQRALESNTDPAEAMERELNKWLDGEGDTRPLPERMAGDQSVKAAEAVARFAQKQGGVTRFVWRNIGETCPICQELDGKIVGAEEAFATPGTLINPNREGQDREDDIPLSYKIRSNVFHGPLHSGCDCVVVPA